jgi:ferrous iron transport protein A
MFAYKGDRKMRTLKDVNIGSTAKVVKLHGEGAIKRRIMDMGITKGVIVRVKRVAPLGDPIELTVRGYELSLRKEDAKMIEVEQDISAEGDISPVLIMLFS